MNDDLDARSEKAGERVCVKIAGKQRHLKEEDGGDPYASGSTEFWQKSFGRRGLDYEEQRCAESDGENVEGFPQVTDISIGSKELPC